MLTVEALYLVTAAAERYSTKGKSLRVMALALEKRENGRGVEGKNTGETEGRLL